MFRKNDLYIEILKFGKDKIEEGIKFSDLIKQLERKRVNINEFRLANLVCSMYVPLDQGKYNWGCTTLKADIPYVLTLESRFRLLEHEELKNANSSSLIATLLAISALIISIIGLYFSRSASNEQMEISKQQLNQSVTINQEQLEDLKFDPSGLYEKLDGIIGNTMQAVK
ncbi:MAG: hypothetical protein UV80_C0002G0109 [Candidatus Peregrinibacteria bacterium GW2011_GWF2_43_17]|nr:MAG: hypothetical protein UV80_C0002G0109 [Candidatus Peregrinibacteria bacterium GW2011_GWF2_43_17]HAU39846.1 hypothetical protein [Candidatus Peregrinibacteria bacterium]